MAQKSVWDWFNPYYETQKQVEQQVQNQLGEQLEKEGRSSEMPTDAQWDRIWSGQNPSAVDQAIDYAEKAAGTNEAAVDKQIKANRPSIFTPFGSQQWTQDANGNWTLNSGLTGQMGDVASMLQGQVGSMFGQPVMTGDAASKKAIDAAYGQATSRLDPMWGQREEQLKSQLANQGLDPTSKAYADALGQFGRDRNDAYSSAMNNAVGLGNQAAQSVFGMNLHAQNAPLQRLLQMQNLLAVPGFSQAGSAGGTDYLGAFGMGSNIDVGRERIAAEERGQAYGAGGDLVGGFTRFSDERLKTRIVRHVAEVLPGVPMATWEYRALPGRRFRGVIAQDLARVAPQHVRQRPDGFLAVDYSFAPHLFREVGNG